MNTLRSTSLILAALLCAARASAQNYALEMQGIGHVEFPQNGLMNTGDTATIEAWVRAPLGQFGRWLTLFERYADMAEHKEVSIKPDGGLDYLYAGSPWAQAPWYGGVTWPGAGTYPTDAQWHHLAFVRHANGTWQLFQDGAMLVNEGPGTGLGSGCWLTCAIINASTVSNICMTSANGMPWQMDELRVSSTDRYSAPFVPARAWIPDASTAMLLDFNEGSGSLVHDVGPALQLGMIVGGPWQWVVVDPEPGIPFCAGDGSGTACPCGPDQSGAAGLGCVNSTGSGAQLASTGLASLAADSVQLHVAQLPAPSFVLFLQGSDRQAGGAGAPFGEGLMCLGGLVRKLAVRESAGGTLAYGAGIAGDVPLSTGGVVMPGSTLHYQVHYRDAQSSCGLATFNTTNGLSLVWLP
jgi:hypothetical protein